MRWLAVRACRDLARRSSDRRRSVARNGPVCQASSGLNAAQRLQARVDVVVRMVVLAVVEPPAADDAQARAVRAAQRRDRLGQLDRLADRRLEVELVVVGQARDVGLVVDRQRPAGRQVERRQVLLLEPDLDRELDVAQAAAALERERRPQVGVGQDAAVGPQEPDPAVDRLRRAAGPRRGRSSTPSTSKTRSAPGSSASSPATFQASGPSSDPLDVTAGCWTARPPRPPIARRRLRRRRRRSPRSPSDGAALVEQGDALLDALERLDDVALEADQDADRVLVGAAPDLVGVAMGVGDDLAALRRRPTGSGRARRSGRRPAPGPSRRSARPPPGPSR